MRNWDKQSSRLSYKVKYVGLAIVILMLMFFAAMLAETFTIAPDRKELVKNAVFSFLLFGLFLIAFAREKIEDERSISLRIRAFATSSGVAVFYVIFKPWINLLLKMPMEVTGQEIVLFMLLSFIFTYNLQKITGKE